MVSPEQKVKLAKVCAACPLFKAEGSTMCARTALLRVGERAYDLEEAIDNGVDINLHDAYGELSEHLASTALQNMLNLVAALQDQAISCSRSRGYNMAEGHKFFEPETLVTVGQLNEIILPSNTN